MKSVPTKRFSLVFNKMYYHFIKKDNLILLEETKVVKKYEKGPCHLKKGKGRDPYGNYGIVV